MVSVFITSFGAAKTFLRRKFCGRGNFHIIMYLSSIHIETLTPIDLWLTHLKYLEKTNYGPLELIMMSNQLMITTSTLHPISRLLCWMNETEVCLYVIPPSKFGSLFHIISIFKTVYFKSLVKCGW